MKVLRADDKGDGAGGGSNATTTTTAGGAGADAGKGAETKGETTLTKAEGQSTETKADTKKAEPVDYAKWSPKAVEGVQRDEKLLGQFREFAKKHSLSPELAQAVVDFDDARTKSEADAYRAERERTRKDWVDSFKNDKEFGGSKWSETEADLSRAMKRFADDGLRKALDESGLGDHPDVLRFVARIGKAMREDSIAGGAGGTSAKKPTLLDQLYGGSSSTAKS